MVSRIVIVILIIGILIILSPFLIFGTMVIAFSVEERSAEKQRERWELQRSYTRIYDGAHKVKLLDVSEEYFGNDDTASAIIEVGSRNSGKNESDSIGQQRQIRIRGLYAAEEECKRLSQKIASNCRIADVDASKTPIPILKMKLHFSNLHTSSQCWFNWPTVTDALQLEYLDKRVGENATGREDIYSKVATHCNDTSITSGRCEIRRLNISTAFEFDANGRKWSYTRARVVITTSRKEDTLRARIVSPIRWLGCAN